jgi:agmatine/peptidylarginine deiminase
VKRNNLVALNFEYQSWGQLFELKFHNQVKEILDAKKWRLTLFHH